MKLSTIFDLQKEIKTLLQHEMEYLSLLKDIKYHCQALRDGNTTLEKQVNGLHQHLVDPSLIESTKVSFSFGDPGGSDYNNEQPAQES